MHEQEVRHVLTQLRMDVDRPVVTEPREPFGNVERAGVEGIEELIEMSGGRMKGGHAEPPFELADGSSSAASTPDLSRI